jgi:hypothetical protein
MPLRIAPLRRGERLPVRLPRIVLVRFLQQPLVPLAFLAIAHLLLCSEVGLLFALVHLAIPAILCLALPLFRNTLLLALQRA